MPRQALVLRGAKGTPDFVIKGRGSGPSKTSHFRPPPWENPPKHRPQTPQALQDSLEETPPEMRPPSLYYEIWSTLAQPQRPVGMAACRAAEARGRDRRVGARRGGGGLKWLVLEGPDPLPFITKSGVADVVILSRGTLQTTVDPPRKDAR